MSGLHLTLVFGLLFILVNLAISVDSHPGKNLLREEMFGQMAKRGRIDKREIADRMLQHMMDVARDLYRDMGADENELREVDRKRSAIMACYFQAISCY